MKPHIRKPLLTLLLLLLAAVSLSAQQLRIESLKAGMEPMYKSIERLDLNREICALVKFQFPFRGLRFEGSIVGDVDYRDGEYRVYFSAPAYRTRVKGEGYYATDVVDLRENFGITLEGNRVYIAKIVVDGAAPTVAAAAPAQPVAPARPWRTEPKNLDLVVEDGGTYYYLSEYEYRKLPTSERRALDKKGLMIIARGERFVMSLTDVDRKITWADAVRVYGDRLPSKRQGEAVASQSKAVDKALIAFGGEGVLAQDFYCIREKRDANSIWYIRMCDGYVQSGVDYSKMAVRTVEILPEVRLIADSWRTRGRNLDLAVEKDGKNYFFSIDEWPSVSTAEKVEMKKLGIVIDHRGERFIWPLFDDASKITWEQANRIYGKRLPSKRQAEAISSQDEAVINAVLSFGGNGVKGLGTNFWTKDKRSPDTAWYLRLGNGDLYSASIKNHPLRVRCIAPVPGE